MCQYDIICWVDFAREWSEVKGHKLFTSGTLSHLILSTTSLVKVSDRRKFGPNRTTAEPSIVQILTSLLGVLLVAELHIRVAGQMLAQIVANVHLLDLAVLVLHLEEELLEYVVEVLLHLFGVVGVEDLVVPRVHGCTQRVDVEVLEEYGLRECWFVVHFRALLAVATCADFEVE